MPSSSPLEFLTVFHSLEKFLYMISCILNLKIVTLFILEPGQLGKWATRKRKVVPYLRAVNVFQICSLAITLFIVLSVPLVSELEVYA